MIWVEFEFDKLNCIDLSWIDLNWVEFDLVKLNCIDLNYVELNCIEYTKIMKYKKTNCKKAFPECIWYNNLSLDWLSESVSLIIANPQPPLQHITLCIMKLVKVDFPFYRTCLVRIEFLIGDH